MWLKLLCCLQMFWSNTTEVVDQEQRPRKAARRILTEYPARQVPQDN